MVLLFIFYLYKQIKATIMTGYVYAENTSDAEDIWGIKKKRIKKIEEEWDSKGYR